MAELLCFPKHRVASRPASYSASSHHGLVRRPRHPGACRLRFPASPGSPAHPDAQVSLQAARTPLAHHSVAGMQCVGRIWPLERVNLACDLPPTNDVDRSDQNDLVWIRTIWCINLLAKKFCKRLFLPPSLERKEGSPRGDYQILLTGSLKTTANTDLFHPSQNASGLKLYRYC